MGCLGAEVALFFRVAPSLGAVKPLRLIAAAIKAFYDRLIEAANAVKVAGSACIRKLWIIFEAITKYGTSWAKIMSGYSPLSC